MMRNIFFVLCILFLGGLAAPAEPLEDFEPSRFPSLISSIRIHPPLDFCGEPVPLANQEVRERLEKELLLLLWDRPQVILWIKRSSRYMPHIEKMLADNGLPADLKYLVVVESALRPHVGSSKGAMGFWQFMSPTGRNYGLKIDSYIDERRNIFASTGAAVRYLKDLHGMLGSWTLAAAAFNMGEKGLEAEILAQKTDKYYYLYLPLETQRYVPRAIAAKLILSSPGKYGFRVRPEDRYPPLAFDRIRIKCSRETPLHVVARAAKTYFKVIKELNPELRGHYLSKGAHAILLPKGAAQGFHARYRRLFKAWRVRAKNRIYVVKKGENLSSIAERFNVPLPALLIWNRLNPKRHIHPGDRLIIDSDSWTPIENIQE